MNGTGALLVFEGAEGVGKSTQVRILADQLTRAGVPHLAVREPGGTPAGNAIRELLLDPRWTVDARAEALLFMASRAQLVRDVIQPAMRDGLLVIADRFFLSTYAYQIAGRGLPEDEIRSANRFATDGLVPDLTLLLDLPVAEGLGRADARSSRDRIERATDEFHQRVGQAFREFAGQAWQARHPECGPILRVDASGREDEVAARILDALETHEGKQLLPLRGLTRSAET